ncbi:ALDH-like protein [Pholiota conissans]|uniref:ALDH-like protein n=1 Tax=Pholiota conissans TaxID=109636 RepID=A0A9P5YIC9_9AGAR|nr:ALDH-like protein [Pholiota conissans]
MTHGYTPIDKIQIYASLRATFRSGLTKPIAWRQHQLLQLALRSTPIWASRCMMHEVVMGEITPVFDRALTCVSKIEEWSKDKSITDQVQDWQKGWTSRIMRRAKGVVLIIACYPMILSLQPLYGALLSSSSPKSHHITLRSSLTICRSYPDKDAFRVALGGVPEITKMLELKWDHIFYTGNGRVARIVATAAAKHLTPFTLELGGKSPVIVDTTADIQLAAKRTLAGKTTNCDQICVTPDFFLVERLVASKFVEACGALNMPSYGAYERLKGLLDRTKGIEPTVIADVEPGDSLLEGEIYGPFLPIVTVENVDGAIDYINDHDHPLVLYFLLQTTLRRRKNTTNGNVCINDTFIQLSISEMPFCGVQYYSYENFVYGRALCEIPYEEEPFDMLRYPSYTAESVAFFSQVMKTPILKSTNPAEVEVKN